MYWQSFTPRKGTVINMEDGGRCNRPKPHDDRGAEEAMECDLEDIETPYLRRLFAYWQDKRRGKAFPSRRDLDPREFAFALGHVLLIDVLDNPQRFRFRLHGSVLSFRARYDMTGRMVDELPNDENRTVLLQTIREKSDIPMVAAGAIVDGRGMASAFAAGAEGIQMGTRFVSSAESPVHRNYKQAIVDAPDTGTVMLNRKGTPCMRALKTQLSVALEATGVADRSTLKSVKEVYFGGDMEASVALAGQTAGLIHEVLPVADIVRNTVEGVHAIRRSQGERSAAGGF